MIKELDLPKESSNLLQDDRSNQSQGADPTSVEIKHEDEIIRMMIKYGTREVLIKEIGNEDKSTSVIELIIQEIESDDLRIEQPLYREIYGLFMDGIKDNTLLSASYLKRMENQEIVAFVSDLESDDRELSHNWVGKYNIHTKSEEDNLYESVMNAIYHFKLIKVEQHIQGLQRELKEKNPQGEDLILLLSEQMVYAKVRKEFSEKLGRIITR